MYVYVYIQTHMCVYIYIYMYMSGFYYCFNNLRLRQTQDIKDCSAAQVDIYFASSEIMNCRLLNNNSTANIYTYTPII